MSDFFKMEYRLKLLQSDLHGLRFAICVAVADYADIARLGHVTRARVTQIMNLLNLAPDIQEEILFLPRTTQGRDPIPERHLRPIAAILDWCKQRNLWANIRRA